VRSQLAKHKQLNQLQPTPVSVSIHMMHKQ